MYKKILGVAVIAGALALASTAFAAPVSIFSDGFESAGVLTGWTTIGSQWGENLINGVLTHTGNKAAVAQGNTGSQPDTMTIGTSTVGYANISFSYWYRVTGILGPNAHFLSQYSTDGGATWTTLADHNNVALTGWNQETFPLPASAANNPNLKIRFQADFNSAVNAVRVDDVLLTGDPIVETVTPIVIHASDLDNTSSNPAVVATDGLNKWFEYNDTNDTIDNTLGSFVTGPSTAPVGTGSIEFTLGSSPNDRKNIATYQFAGTALNAIEKLSFSAYSHSGVASPTESPYLNFNIDFTGSNAWQSRLVYVPSQNGAVPQNQWNTFDAISGGNAKWNYSGATWPVTVVGPDANLTGIPGNTLRTWSAILADYPNAKILSSDPWFGVRVGEPGPSGYTGDVDNITIGILSGANLTTKTFDFEPTPAPACNPSSTFDTFATGSVNGQGGWQVTNPSFDQSVVSNTYGFPTFGCQTLRISDSYTSGTFGDQIFSPSVTNEAGEADALNGGFSGGVRQNHFEAQFDIASAQALGLQPGMSLSVSPDRGDGARMSYLRFVDESDGIHVFFDDVQGQNVGFQVANFVETDIATLDRTQPHTIKFDMTFVDGPSNDIVNIYIDGNLVHTGTSWENYYRFDTESQGYPTVDPSLYNKSRTVDSLLFREGGTANPADAGKGFLIDNVSLNSSTVNGNLVINKYSCPIGTTVTRVANGVGGTVPAGCVPQAGATFGYVHGTQTDANSPFPELTQTFTALSATDVNGVSTTNLPATGRYLVAETDSNGNQLAANAVVGLYCTGDGDTSGTNDNQELTFVPPNGDVHCVAYDQAMLPAPTPVSPADGTVTTTAAQQLIDWTDVGADDSFQPITYFYQVANDPTINPADGSFVTPVFTSTALSSSSIATPNTPDGVYYWHVYAQDSNSNKSPWSITQQVTVAEPAPATPGAITDAADNIGQTSATAHGTDGGVDADDTSFWWGTTPLSGLTPGGNVAEFPATNWNHDTGLGPVGAGGNFSEPLPGLTASTTYYFVAWVEVGGTWYPGDVLNFTTTNAPAVPGATTDDATSVSETDATLNGTNGGVSADGESFWVSTSTFDTSSPNIPANVYSTPVLGGVGAGAAFSDPLSLVTTNGIVTGDVNQNMPAITPGTTYYFVAWSDVGGTWYPGGMKTVTTATPVDTTTPVLTVNGNNPSYIKVNSTYVDQGVTISDTPTNNLSYTISTDGTGTTTSGSFTLDTSTEGTHTLVYSATDGGGNTGTTSRTVIVDGTAPTVTLTSTSSDPTTDNPISVTATFSEPVTGFDQGDLSATNAAVGNFQASSTDNLVYTFDLTPAGSSPVEVTVAPSAFADLAGNDNTAGADFTRGIGSPSVPSGPTPSFTSFSSGTNGPPSGLGGSSGFVLGTSTESTGGSSGPSCTSLIPTFLRQGAHNDPNEVKSLQVFLNGELGTTIPVSGFFGPLTVAGVDQFQIKYWQDVLAPWVPFGLPTDHTPTGFVGKTTSWKINMLVCPALDLPAPQVP